MGTNLMGELVANNGTYIVNSPEENIYRTIDAIVVLEDTFFQYIFIGEDDVLSDYVLGGSAFAVKAGAIITPMGDAQFSGVNIFTGSVALVLG